SLLLDDDIAAINPNRVGQDTITVTNIATSLDQPSVTATGNQVSTGILGNPKLYIGKSANPGPSARLTYNTNQQITYTINYQNKGNAPASNVVISDILPTALIFNNVQLPTGVTSVTPPAGSPPNLLLFNVGLLDPNVGGSININTTVQGL